MQLTDISSSPRSGVKGKATTERLRALGATIPDVNAAAPQQDGSLMVRLGENEYLVLATGLLLGEITAFRMGDENDAGFARSRGSVGRRGCR